MERGKGGGKRNECTTERYKQVTHKKPPKNKSKKQANIKKIIEKKDFESNKFFFCL